nr:glucose dehydrogenase [FAD, quinone]-like [Leptinotarsa decemlineata]
MAVIALSTILTAVKAGVALIGVGKIAILPFLIAAVTYFHYDQFDPENRPVDRKQVDSSYDFIIVGGGSAGSVLANRLTEIAGWKVLLLEAGGHETEITDVPILSLYLHKSKVDWGYKTEPQETACQAMVENRCSWTRGKVLGGSSVLNTMLYIRGNKRDFNRWADYGNEGWSYEEVLPYFKKSEDQRNPYLAKNRRYHSTELVEKSGQSMIQPEEVLIIDEPELSVTADHAAIQINMTPPLVNDETFTAEPGNKGVTEPLLSKTDKELKTAVPSPSALSDQSIFQNKDLTSNDEQQPSTSQNLQDHISSVVTFLIDHPISLVINRLVNLNTALRYAVKEDGPLTSSIGLETVGFIPTKYANRSDDWPDMEFMLTSTTTPADGGTQVKKAHGLSDEFYKEVYESINFIPSIMSNNPLEYPLLYHNYLTHPHDVNVLREGTKAAVAFGQTEALKRFGARFHSVPVPKCKHLPQFTDEYWNCYIRQYTLSIYHYSCTAKMGPESDPYAVVDPQLRVYGISGLRVIDASIMPFITNGNINAPVIMIGEKGADLVKSYWLTPTTRKRRRDISVNYNMKLQEKPYCNETLT